MSDLFICNSALIVLYQLRLFPLQVRRSVHETPSRIKPFSGRMAVIIPQDMELEPEICAEATDLF